MLNNDAGIAPEKKLAETSKVSVYLMDGLVNIALTTNCQS
jgi:hypothetical protein